ncbi:MAG: hypothetical protein ACE37F_12285 [Nannocystaceae bacterium]|nr:hypothetical protein [bacterium]
MTEPQPPRTRGLLLGIGAALVVLSALFGWRTLQQRNEYDAYKRQTMDEADLPWTTEHLEVDACVSWTTNWGMECTGMEAWCLGEAPRLTMACMEASDRAAFCEEAGDAVASTHFGYAECEALREGVQGRHLKRAHKKYCAAAYRAVAEHCRQRAMQ